MAGGALPAGRVNAKRQGEKDLLDEKGFDLWADGYDEAVGLSDERDTYPFAGYGKVLGRIYRAVTERPGCSVLDVGFGTGTLTSKLYEKGCRVYGQDFSGRMLAVASLKMPGARLYRGDVSEGLVPPLRENAYDFIVATYSLHHLPDERKASLLRELRGVLAPGGSILVGDVAFETREQLEECRKEAGEDWDCEEYYFVYEELKKLFPDLAFERVSRCAGILRLA